MDNAPLRSNRKKSPNPNRRGMKNAGFIAIIVLIGLIIFAASNQPSTLQKRQPRSVFKHDSQW
jgi:uncharacterized membrane protein